MGYGNPGGTSLKPSIPNVQKATKGVVTANKLIANVMNPMLITSGLKPSSPPILTTIALNTEAQQIAKSRATANITSTQYYMGNGQWTTDRSKSVSNPTVTTPARSLKTILVNPVQTNTPKTPYIQPLNEGGLQMGVDYSAMLGGAVKGFQSGGLAGGIASLASNVLGLESYGTKSKSSGRMASSGMRTYRRMNPLNAHAIRRSATRIRSFQKFSKRIENSLPHKIVHVQGGRKK
jgi:hypothetical protein